MRPYWEVNCIFVLKIARLWSNIVEPMSTCCRELSLNGRDRAKLSIKCGSNQLKKKKQAKNGRLESLIIYCDDISKSWKPERALAPLFYFLPWKDALVKCREDQHRCGAWAYCCRSTEQKARIVLCTWGIEEGKEKGLEMVNSEHLEQGSVLKLHFSPLHSPQSLQWDLSKDYGRGPVTKLLVKKTENEGTEAQNANSKEPGWQGCLSPLQRVTPSATAAHWLCTKSHVNGAASPMRPDR